MSGPSSRPAAATVGGLKELAYARRRAQEIGARLEEIAGRLTVLRDRAAELAGDAEVTASAAEQARRADVSRRLSVRRLQTARLRAAWELRMAAAVHDRVAALHERFAKARANGAGQHLEVARGHRAAALADREVARVAAVGPSRRSGAP